MTTTTQTELDEKALEAARAAYHDAEIDPSPDRPAIAEAIRAYLAALSKPSDEGWIEWKGGECPIPGLLGHQYEILIDGSPTPIRATAPANERRWTHKGRPTDIIAYRVVQP